MYFSVVLVSIIWVIVLSRLEQTALTCKYPCAVSLLLDQRNSQGTTSMQAYGPH